MERETCFDEPNDGRVSAARKRGEEEKEIEEENEEKGGR